GVGTADSGDSARGRKAGRLSAPPRTSGADACLVKAESGMIRALRTLRNEPGFALSSVFTLALGIACSSAMFSLFYAVLLAPVPYADPLRVVAIHTRSNTTGRQTIRLSGGDWSDLAASG